MNVLLSTIGRRSYIAEYFRDALTGRGLVVGTTDRHSLDSEFTVGLLSCDRRYIVPSLDSSLYINSILDICGKERISILCSLYDLDCHILSDHVEKFEEIGVAAFIPCRSVSDICYDKLNTHKFLKEAGLGTPATFQNISDFLDSGISYPVVVKPRFGFGSLNMYFARNDRELSACFDRDVHIIQAAIRGEEYSFDIFNDCEKRVLSCVVKRKLRMRAGETDQAITVKDPNLLELGVHIGESLGHVGPLDVDFFVTEKEILILEFNPRFGGGYPISHAAGACFPELMVEIALGKRPKSIIGNYKEDIVMVKEARAVTLTLDVIMEGCQRISKV